MLRKVNFKPGFNKQLTPSGVEAGWIGGDYARFRYGMPEKIGGWEETQTDILPGAGRKLFGWFDFLMIFKFKLRIINFKIIIAFIIC